MFPLDRPQLVANGNIRPNRFLTTVTGNANFLLVVEATADSQFIIGISGSSTRYAPNSPGDDGYNAIAGETMEGYISEGMIGQLKLGGTVDNMGSFLAAGAAGVGVATALANAKYYGAIPLRAGLINETIPVYVKFICMPAS